MNNTAWLYGGILAALVILLQLFEYYLAISIFPTPVYIGIIALLFTGLGIWLGKKLTSKPAEEAPKPTFKPNKKAIESLGISERELEVLEQLAKGKSNQQIADILFISVNTVKTHLSSLYQKLEVSRRSMAVKQARTLKLIP
jgi:DNA-binding CsgD family transcriptional regulator